VEDLKKRAAIMMKSDGRALIEEFIEGREYTCLAAENPDDPEHPLTFQPVEFIFPEGETFKHYNMKWVDYDR
jgi:D-alanine-D-alanine ligase